MIMRCCLLSAGALLCFLGSTIVAVVVDAQEQQVCSARITPSDSVGPFFIANSPERTVIVNQDQLQDPSNVLYVEGTVYGKDCIPMDAVLLELWYAGQADASGNAYSIAGSDLNYRGQIRTDACGHYTLTQTFPEPYSGDMFTLSFRQTIMDLLQRDYWRHKCISRAIPPIISIPVKNNSFP